MRCARVACAALFVLLTALAAEGLYIKLPPRTQECIHRIATQGQPLVGSFEVSRGGDLDIDAKVSTVPAGAASGQRESLTTCSAPPPPS